MDTQVLDLMKIAVTGLFGAVITPLVTQVVIPTIKMRLSVAPSTVDRGRSGGSAHSHDAPPVRETAEGGIKDRRPNKKLAILLWGAIGVVVFGLLAYTLVKPTFISSCPLFAAQSAAVTYPSEGAALPLLITAQGTECNLPGDKQFWLLVVAEGVQGFFPQNQILVSSDGRWSASAILGQKGAVDVGREFVLYTALADASGQAAIRSYFAPAPDFKPLYPLPGGIQLINQVHVVRR